MSAWVGPLAFLPSMSEWVVLLLIGLLLFGKNLPQVLKDAGRHVAELKRMLDKLRSQLNEDKDFRELTSAAQDLRDAVTAPKRMLEEKVRSAVFEARSEVESLHTQVASAAEPPPQSFEGLTDESRASPGPDATFVEPPGKSIFE